MATNTIPVRFQLVVSIHDGSFHLFEMDYDEMFVIYPGMLLMGVPGVPNIVGSDAEFDNKVVRLAWNGEMKRHLAQVGALRMATADLDEAKSELPEWQYARELTNVRDAGPQDMLNG